MSKILYTFVLGVKIKTAFEVNKIPLPNKWGLCKSNASKIGKRFYKNKVGLINSIPPIRLFGRISPSAGH